MVGLLSFPLDGYDVDAVASAEQDVRDYCGWHIAPSLTEDVVPVSFNQGVLTLPSLYVTSVNSVTVNVNGVLSSVPVQRWDALGRVFVDWLWCDPENDSVNLYRFRESFTVNITHGYAACPANIRKTVAYLAKDGLVPQAQVSAVTSGPFNKQFYELPGSGLGWADAYRLPVCA